MLGAEVADGQLRRFVVRIEAPEGTAGTGVLVAPGWVLTCAHVVGGRDVVRVVPDRTAAPDTAAVVPSSVSARVRARSDPPAAASASEFWPYPDLALLELDGWTDHLCAPLSAAEPGRASEPHSWGFGRREEGVWAVGSAASFDYVGLDGDGYLQLKAGDAAPGLSGAPLVCPQRRAVVGVMSVSRDLRDARGGWASPVAALGSEPGVPTELARLGLQVLTRNQEVTWRHRDVWHRVLPIPGAEALVDRPWDGAVLDPESAQPSTMLRAEFRVVPFRFRDPDLAAFQAWCDGPARLAVSYLDAPGGAGKTRFAIEACVAMQAQGWVAGLLPRPDRGGDAVPLPRLFVVDYVEERDAAALAERLAALERSATALVPVRVLLLSRPVVWADSGWVLEPLRAQASGAALAAVEAAKDRSSAAAMLAVADRRELFALAVAEFGRHWHGSARAVRQVTGADLADDRYGQPLDVLLEAYDAVLSRSRWRLGGRRRPDDRTPVDRALDHEARHWSARMPGVEPRILTRCVALASLAGARNDAEVQALFELVPDLADGQATRRRLDQWLRGLYPGTDRWNPLRPDRLGEALIARELRRDEDRGRALLIAVLDLHSDAQVERALDVLIRLVTHGDTGKVIVKTVWQRHAVLVKRCTEQTRGTAQRPGRTGLLDALARLHTMVLTDHRVVTQSIGFQHDSPPERSLSREAQLILEGIVAIDERRHGLEPGNTADWWDLVVSYERLADLARAAGRLGDAEELYRQALRVRQELTKLEPENSTYRRLDLFDSYNRLADLARAAGRLGDAEELYRGALQVSQELTDLEPNATSYQWGLSVTYERLADLVRDAGRAAEAEELYWQALQVHQELTERELGSTTYRRDLSISDCRDPSIYYQRLVNLAQALTELERGNTTSRRDLTRSYERLADLARDAARSVQSSDGAEELCQQVLQIAQVLTDLEPANTTYRQDLAISHNRLVDLAQDAGRTAEAEELYRQALQIAQELTDLEPANTTYQQDLLRSYNRLADLARDAGRTTEAEELYRQALQVRQVLTDLEPANTTYRRNLAISYERLGDLVRDAGRTAEAEELHRQALQVRQKLTNLKPANTTYRRDLSISYNRLADLARDAGRTTEAEELYRQALQVRQVLTDLEPANTTYRQDLLRSYNRLADLVRDAGRTTEAEELYRQALQVRQVLTDLEPANTTYRQDL
ncbi:MAG: tetratricopeptide repeat protein, partial [Actinomycetota bacterium]|nr:tetratricopeptide repeat protein [Actinomycetota bacterium]